MADAPLAERTSTRRGPPEDREAARRARLIEAGLLTFGTQGYARSAIEDLCARAGVSTKSFYTHFASKEELLVAVYEQIVEQMVGRVTAVLPAEPATLAAYVRPTVQAGLDETLGDERAARVRLLEVVGVSERLERDRREVLHRFADMFVGDTRRVAALGLIPQPLSPIKAMALVGATNELCIDWLLSERRPSRRRMVDELSELWMSVLSFAT